MKRYPALKDSGAEWIGEIPVAWDIKPLGLLACEEKYSFVDGPFGSDLKNEEYVESGIPLIQLNNIGIGNHYTDNLRFITKEKSEDLRKHKAYPNEIVIAKMADPVGRATLVSSEYDCYNIVADCVKLKPNPSLADGKFVVYSLNSSYLRHNAELCSGGTTRLRINLSALKKLRIIYPSLSEQSQIATFLDHKTRQIDDLIAKKQKIIELLKEERTALINQAVTKGLDPTVPMMDSGIEWLGEIPEHWEVKKLKYLIDGKLAYGANEAAEEEYPENPRYIRITDFGNDGILKDDTFKSLPSEIAREYLLKEGDVLFARSGATVGKTFQFKDYQGLACFAGYLIRASPNCKMLDSDFLYFFTKSSIYENWKDSIFIQATIQNIGADKYSLLLIPIPPLQQQKAISGFLKHKTSQIDDLIAKQQILSDQLTEYKTSLINEAVTGKIDVRDYQISHA